MGKINLSKLEAMAPKPSKRNSNDNVINMEDAMNNTNTTATVNNTNAKENKMDTEIRTSEMSASEFAAKYQEMGYDAFFPRLKGVAQSQIMIGYHGEEDGKAAMELLNQAYAASGNDIYKTMFYVKNAMEISANDITVDDHVTIDGEDFIIDYKKRKIYQDSVEIANLDNIECYLPNEAIKQILIEKVREMIDHYNYED